MSKSIQMLSGKDSDSTSKYTDEVYFFAFWTHLLILLPITASISITPTVLGWPSNILAFMILGFFFFAVFFAFMGISKYRLATQLMHLSTFLLPFFLAVICFIVPSFYYIFDALSLVYSDSHEGLFSRNVLAGIITVLATKGMYTLLSPIFDNRYHIVTSRASTSLLRVSIKFFYNEPLLVAVWLMFSAAIALVAHTWLALFSIFFAQVQNPFGRFVGCTSVVISFAWIVMVICGIVRFVSSSLMSSRYYRSKVQTSSLSVIKDALSKALWSSFGTIALDALCSLSFLHRTVLIGGLNRLSFVFAATSKHCSHLLQAGQEAEILLLTSDQCPDASSKDNLVSNRIQALTALYSSMAGITLMVFELSFLTGAICEGLLFKDLMWTIVPSVVCPALLATCLLEFIMRPIWTNSEAVFAAWLKNPSPMQEIDLLASQYLDVQRRQATEQADIPQIEA